METSPVRPMCQSAERAYDIRRNALLMGEVQGQGYIAQALGIADVLAVAYFHAMRYRPEDPEWEGRDRFLLSIGHYAIALYAALIEAGIVPEDELETYGSDDSRLPMSGMASYTPGMEISGGSLGQGLALAVGYALASQAQEVGRVRLLPVLGRRVRRRRGLGRRVGRRPLEARQPDRHRRRQQPAGGRPVVGSHGARGAGRPLHRFRLVHAARRRQRHRCRGRAPSMRRARSREPKPRIIICDTKMAKGVPFLEERGNATTSSASKRTSGRRRLAVLEAGRTS